MNRLVVKRHRPLYIILAVLLFSILLSFIIWFLADDSHWRLIRQQMNQTEEYRDLWQLHEKVAADNERLQHKLNVLQTNNELDRRAAAGLQDEVMRLQDEIYQLTRELEFYKGVVSATREDDGLKIQGLLVDPTRVEGRYRFKLVLTHVTNSDIVAAGTAEIALEGDMNGATRKLALNDLTLDESLSLEYEFKHFKRFEGFFELPAGFTPRRIVVELVPKGNAGTRIERAYDWLDVTG
jgi:hypothetical protein